MSIYSLYNEKELLTKLVAGDEMALAEIYQRYWQSLFISAFNILKDRAACEDILQELFLQLWLKRGNIEITSSLLSYLNAATRYQVFHHLRKHAAIEYLFENLEERLATPSADKGLQLKELNNRVNEVVETLPAQCRLIYKMSREENLSHKEIAKRLSISTKTVENQLTIALRRIRTSLGNTFH